MKNGALPFVFRGLRVLDAFGNKVVVDRFQGQIHRSVGYIELKWPGACRS